MRTALAVVAALAISSIGALTAQANRHELGLRLRSFERALAATEDEARRDAAFVALERAVQAFFRMDMASVGAAIDEAELALSGRVASGAEQFARCLQLRLGKRLVDAAGDQLTIDVRPLYAVVEDGEDAEMPEGLELRWRFHDNAPWQQRALGELPAQLDVDVEALPEGDHQFCWSLTVGDDELVSRSMAFAAAGSLAARLDAAVAAAKSAGKLRPKSVESLTLASLGNLLRTTQRRSAYETELAGAALLREAELLAARLEAPDAAPVYVGSRPGSFRLRVPVEDGVVSCRLFAPEVEDGERPIVVALHGAGGSENLFFDGYGDGLCVDLARERGWFVVSPRNGVGFVDCAALVDALAERYPIDAGRVFVVGHSMGAMQTMNNLSRRPARFRAAAPIAGGGRVRASEALASVPFFVSAGARDFGRQGSRRLHQQLQEAGAKAAWRLYPSVEHLAIVQVALPDVFSFFDQHVR